MRSFFIAFVFVLWPLAAYADAPAEITPYIKADKPFGEARLTKLVFKVYDATLWTDSPAFSMKKPFALSLRYLMDFKAKDLASRSIEEMDGQAKLDKADAAAWQSTLQKLFPDVKKGDRITAVYLPGRETRLYYNGAYRGRIGNPTFSQRFIGIWMSPKTSEPALRSKLVGGK